MIKYKVLGKHWAGNVGDIVELREEEGEGAVAVGKLEKVTTVVPSKSKTARKPRRKSSGNK